MGSQTSWQDEGAGSMVRNIVMESTMNYTQLQSTSVISSVSHCNGSL